MRGAAREAGAGLRGGQAGARTASREGVRGGIRAGSGRSRSAARRSGPRSAADLLARLRRWEGRLSAVNAGGPSLREIARAGGRARLRGAVLALSLAACAHAPPPRGSIEVAPGVLLVRCEDGVCARDCAEVEEAARRALPALRRWGSLAAAVEIEVLPTHEALEEAIRRPGWSWLRAWARYDDVFLQAPGSWGTFQGRIASLSTLLSHELTHCAMFQAAAGPADWTSRRIPLWFREGMASWAAGQERRRLARSALAPPLAQDTSLDPFADGEALSRSDPGLVYSAAHWAFVDLVARFGEAGVRRVLAAMKSGLDFPAAFGAALGISPADFTEDELRRLRRP